MPTPSVVAASNAAVAEPTAKPTAPDGGQGVDKLAAELKALRVQAQNTQAELASLQQQTPALLAQQSQRGTDAVVALSLAAFALGLLALRWRFGRRRVVRPASAAARAQADSSFQPPALTAPAAGPTSTPMPVQPPQPGASAEVSPSAPGHGAVASSPPERRPVVQDSAFRPSSLDVTFVDSDSLDSSMSPLTAPRRDGPFAAPELGLAFDPEAAASEVERVRKSLAAKRSERVRLPSYGSEIAWRDDEPSDAPSSLLQSDLLFASGPSVPPEAPGVDVLIELSDPSGQSDALPLSSDVAAAHALPPPEPEGELDVSVSLIQELRGLGLWSEARELAKEVVSTAQTPLDPDIATSLHKVQHGEPASGAERRKRERG
ncbi:MAG: hypothetical protein IPO19_10055 [Rhodoferax sp.]|nr:hypothetical protein [Rhodoferax sp.]